MAMIEFKNVSKWYGSFQVLKNCTTQVEKGEVIVVCGPSGSGKSTLIKCVNGLEPFQQGDVIVNGQSVGAKTTNLPQLRAKIGMVFQNFELFPHMNVTANLNLAQIKVLGRSPGQLLQSDRTDPATIARISQALGEGRAVRAELLANPPPVPVEGAPASGPIDLDN